MSTDTRVEIGSSTRVPVSRYTSPEFAAVEQERMWPRVWTVACTVDHVREPGDFFEYRFGRYSVVVVRDEASRLHAFQNVCLHRGNALCQGSGTGLSELRCPYHRWAWTLAGVLREVPSRKGFGALDTSELGLLPARVDTWGPLVFVNLDLGAEPLADYLEGVPADTAWADLDGFRCSYATLSAVDSNWKVVADGFSETYHIQGIHQEMLASVDDVNTEQNVWDRHSVSHQRYGLPSVRARDRSDQAVWDSFIVTQGPRMGPAYEAGSTAPQPPPGETIRDVIAAKIREHQATRGVDMAGYDTDGILRLSQYNLFPNSTVLVWGDMLNVLTSRPGPTPDQAELVMYLLYRQPDGTVPAADAPRPFDITLPPDVSVGTVIDQDLAMLKRFQRGLHQPGFTHLTLSSEEIRIVNMHRVLETYVGD
ncbi:MAG TPA: aromatic ring-hydroxylating dioxygenase subunit alpha [Ilumatobacteraceae bacterium]